MEVLSEYGLEENQLTIESLNLQLPQQTGLACPNQALIRTGFTFFQLKQSESSLHSDSFYFYPT
jgi:hypothetical protein